VIGRVRTIPNKAPNIEYPIILAPSDTNTDIIVQYGSVLILKRNIYNTMPRKISKLYDDDDV